MASYRSSADLPSLLPVFPLDGALLLPGSQLPLNIFEPRYLNMIDDAMGGERMIGMIQTRAGGTRERPALCGVGCAGRITSYAETSDGRYLVTLTGVARFRAGAELNVPSPYRQLHPDFLPFAGDLQAGDEGPELEQGRSSLLDALRAYLAGRGLEIDWSQADEAPMQALVNSLSTALPFEVVEKQALLEAHGMKERRTTLVKLLLMGAAMPNREDDDDGPPIQ